MRRLVGRNLYGETIDKRVSELGNHGIMKRFSK